MRERTSLRGAPTDLRWLMVTAAVIALTACPAASLAAQRSELRDGARIRLRAPDVITDEAEGLISGVRGDTLLFISGSSPQVRVPFSAIRSIAVYRGRSHKRGVLEGAAWGAGIGLAAGFLSQRTSCNTRTCDGGSRAATIGVLTAVGAAAGAMLGRVRGGDRWETLGSLR